MAKIDRLTREARDAATWRGHDMTARFERWTYPFGNGFRVVSEGRCRDCGAYVQCDTSPPPNGIDIGGDAVAIGCN